MKNHKSSHQSQPNESQTYSESKSCGLFQQFQPEKQINLKQMTTNNETCSKQLNIQSLININNVLQQKNMQLELQVDKLNGKINQMQLYIEDLNERLQGFSFMAQQIKGFEVYIKTIQATRQHETAKIANMMQEQKRLNVEIQYLRSQNYVLVNKLNLLEQQLYIKSKRQNPQIKIDLEQNRNLNRNKIYSFENIPSAKHENSINQQKKASNNERISSSHEPKYIIYKKQQKEVDLDLIMRQFAKQTRANQNSKHMMKLNERKDRRMAQVQRQIYMISEKNRNKTVKSDTLSVNSKTSLQLSKKKSYN